MEFERSATILWQDDVAHFFAGDVVCDLPSMKLSTAEPPRIKLLAKKGPERTYLRYHGQ